MGLDEHGIVGLITFLCIFDSFGFNYLPIASHCGEHFLNPNSKAFFLPFCCYLFVICREVPFPGMAGTGVLPFIRGIDLTLNDLEAEKFPEAMEDMTSLR